MRYRTFKSGDPPIFHLRPFLPPFRLPHLIGLCRLRFPSTREFPIIPVGSYSLGWKWGRRMECWCLEMATCIPNVTDIFLEVRLLKATANRQREFAVVCILKKTTSASSIALDLCTFHPSRMLFPEHRAFSFELCGGEIRGHFARTTNVSCVDEYRMETYYRFKF